LGEHMMIDQIQQLNGEYYVLGFECDEDLVIRYNFVAKFKDRAICEKIRITENEAEFYRLYLWQTMFGTMLDGRQKINKEYTLEFLWAFYRERCKNPPPFMTKVFF